VVVPTQCQPREVVPEADQNGVGALRIECRPNESEPPRHFFRPFVVGRIDGAVGGIGWVGHEHSVRRAGTGGGVSSSVSPASPEPGGRPIRPPDPTAARKCARTQPQRRKHRMASLHVAGESRRLGWLVAGATAGVLSALAIAPALGPATALAQTTPTTPEHTI